jgi:hypothetical protein
MEWNKVVTGAYIYEDFALFTNCTVVFCQSLIVTLVGSRSLSFGSSFEIYFSKHANNL